MRGILLVFVLALFLMPQTVLGQRGSVQGTITDTGGLPVPGAHVILDRLGTGTASDHNGTFAFADLPEGEYIATISAVGFEAVNVRIVVHAEGVTPVQIELRERTLEAAEVVVTAARRTQATALVPVSVSLVTREDLLNRNVRSLDQALQVVPGVQMAENQVNIRGSSGFSYNVGSRVLLLVDGVPMLGPETGGIPFDAIPMPQVARIEVIKGPSSALYGSGALGGIINVITREFPEQPETSASVFAGFHDPVRHATWRSEWDGADELRPLGGVSLTHARRLGNRAGGWLHVSYRRDRGYLRLGEDEVFQTYAKLGWDPSQRIALKLFGGITARERDSFLYWDGLDNALSPGTLDLLAPGGNEATGSNDNRSLQLSILPTFRHILSPRLLHHLRLRYFLIQIRPIDEFGNSRPLEAGTTGFRFGGEWQLDWSAGEGKYLTAGVSVDANAARSDFFRASEDKTVFGQPEFAAFIQHERMIASRLSVLAGLRFDAYQMDTTSTASRLSPMLSFSYSATPSLSLRASYGHGFRVPGIAERYVDNQDFFPFYPNYALRPELSTGYELGMRLSGPDAVAYDFDVDAALFWNEYKRLVEPQFVTDPEAVGALRPGFQFVNLTSARIAGADVTLELGMGDYLSVRAGYTYLRARDLEADLPLAFRSPHLVKLGADLELPLGFQLGADYRAATKPDRVDSDFARFVPDADVMVSTHVLDVRLRYRLHQITTSALVLNALDYYYVERPAYLAPPRRFVLQVQVDL